MTIPETLFGRIASVEKTPELSDFWQSRYTQFLQPRYCIIHPKTLEALDLEILNKPFTPTAEIQILSCLNEDGTIHTPTFQEVIYTTVRFLDSCIDSIHFDEISRSSVEGLRKIGVGIGQLEEYMKRHENVRPESIIDSVGSQFASLVYRASESLANEKGEFQEYQKYKQLFLGKSFENAVHPESGMIEDVFSLQKRLDENTRTLEGWVVIPRRNYQLLVVPRSRAWSRWSDRIKESEVSVEQAEVKKEYNVPQTEASEGEAQSYESNTKFQEGELVRIARREHPKYLSIVQIAGLEQRSGTEYYRIASHDITLDGTEWKDTELQAVITSELIESIDNALRVHVYLVVTTQERDGEVLVTENGTLPNFLYEPQSLILQSCTSYISELCDDFADIQSITINNYQEDIAQHVLNLHLHIQLKNNVRGKWYSIDSDVFQGEEKKILTHVVQTIRQKELNERTIEKLKKDKENQKNVIEVQRLELETMHWIRKFDTVRITKEIELSNGCVIVCIFDMQGDAITSIQLQQKEGGDPSSTTIVKLVEMSLNSHLSTIRELLESIRSLAAVARTTQDSISSELLSALEKLIRP